MDPSFARRFQGKMAAVQEDGGSQSSPMARARPSNLSNHGGGGGGAYASPGPPSHMSSLSGGSDMGTHTAVAAAATATAAPQPGYSSAGRPKNRRLQASSGVSRERPDGGIQSRHQCIEIIGAHCRRAAANIHVAFWWQL